MAIGTPTAVASPNTASATGNRNSVTLINVTCAPGTKLLAFAGGGNGTATTITFSDSSGNTWVTVTPVGVGSPSVAIGYCEITNALSNGSITATWDTTVNTDYLLEACFVDGLAFGLGNASPQTATGAAAAWGNTLSLVTTAASEIIFGVGIRSTATTNTPGGSNVEFDDWTDGSRTMAINYQIVAAGTYTPNGTWLNGGTWRAVGCSFAIAGAVAAAGLPAFKSSQTVPFMSNQRI